MYRNIGGKIKGLASLFCWGGILVSMLCGVGLLATGEGGFQVFGIIIMILGSLVSWIGSFAAYGFGQLIENSDILVEFATRISSEEENSKLANDDKIAVLNKWRADGLITEEEYNERLESLK